MRYLAILILLAVVLLGGVAYRALQVAPYPLGSGSSKKSPNGQYEAHASNMTNLTFWGSEESYYEFEIINIRRHSLIKSHRMSYSHGVPVFDFYGDGVVQWNSSSSQVDFGDAATTVWSTPVP